MKSLTATKSRVKPSRSAQLGAPVNGVFPLLLTVTKGAKVERFGYYVEPLASDLGGRAFRLTKLPHQVEEGQDPAYDVLLYGNDSSCSCLGFLRWGHRGPCKHISACAALVSRNRI
jgi:hypothetical protein